MGNFAAEHASARADIGANGVEMTFTLDVNAYDDVNGRLSRSSTSTVTGAGMRVEGEPDLFAEADLKVQDGVQVMFVADTYGEKPELGSWALWNGRKHTVRARRPFEPDGDAIFTYVVLVS